MTHDPYATRGQTIDRWTLGLTMLGGLALLPFAFVACLSHLGWLN